MAGRFRQRCRGGFGFINRTLAEAHADLVNVRRRMEGVPPVRPLRCHWCGRWHLEEVEPTEQLAPPEDERP